jgi:hypothetical protein
MLCLLHSSSCVVQPFTFHRPSVDSVCGEVPLPWGSALEVPQYGRCPQPEIRDLERRSGVGSGLEMIVEVESHEVDDGEKKLFRGQVALLQK